MNYKEASWLQSNNHSSNTRIQRSMETNIDARNTLRRATCRRLSEWQEVPREQWEA